MEQFLKEVLEVMEWYAKETTGFSRKYDGYYVPVSRKADYFLSKWATRDDKGNLQLYTSQTISDIPVCPNKSQEVISPTQLESPNK